MTIRNSVKEFRALLIICLVLTALVLWQKPTVTMTSEDAGTILTTARLFRIQNSQPNEPEDWFIKEMLVQLGYHNCRDRIHYDEIGRCQQKITLAEIELVRLAIKNPDAATARISISKR